MAYESFYGAWCGQLARYNFPHFHCVETCPLLGHRNLFWYSMHPTSLVQPPRLPWCWIIYGIRCNQPARYNPLRFHNVGTLSTLPQCRNCSTLPRHRNLLRYFMQPIYGTRCTQPTRYNLPHSWRRNPFMILDAAN